MGWSTVKTTAVAYSEQIFFSSLKNFTDSAPLRVDNGCHLNVSIFSNSI